MMQRLSFRYTIVLGMGLTVGLALASAVIGYSLWSKIRANAAKAGASGLDGWEAVGLAIIMIAGLLATLESLRMHRALKHHPRK